MTSITRPDYDDKLHKVYAKARRLLPETVLAWMAFLTKYIDHPPGMPILDLGSGTGRFSHPIAEHFNCRVVGVEPSDCMRQQAEEAESDPRVSYLKGDATHIPLPDCSCSHAWLSMVIHNVDDLRACALELRRVLAPDGLAFIRNSFKELVGQICMYEFFPLARQIDEERIPSSAEVITAFGRGGMALVAHEHLDQVIDRSFREHVDRIRQRGISTLQMIGDDDFGLGIEQMEHAIPRFPPDQAVTERIDLLVLKGEAQEARG